MKLFSETCLWTIVVVLLASGILKLISFSGFRATVLRIPYVPIPIASFLACAAVLAELGTAILLCFNAIIGKIAAIALFTLFIFVTVLILKAGLRIKCNCFGSAGHTYFSKSNILTNLVLIGITSASFHVDYQEYIGISAVAALGTIFFTMSLATSMANMKAIIALDRNS